MLLAGTMIDGQQYLQENIAESKYSIFQPHLLPVLLPRSLGIILDLSPVSSLDKELLNEMKYFRKHKILSKYKNISLMLISGTFFHVLPLELQRSSHAKFSTEVCLFRSFISDPELTGPPSIYQNPGFSSYFRQPSRQWSE